MRRLLRVIASTRRAPEGLDGASDAPSMRSRQSRGLLSSRSKAGFRVDIGVRAFMPASRSGVRERTKCRISSARKSSAESPNSIPRKKMWWLTAAWFSRRSRLAARQSRFLRLQEGAVVQGPRPERDGFRRICGYRRRRRPAACRRYVLESVGKPADVVKAGDELTVKILKIDPAKQEDFARFETAAGRSLDRRLAPSTRATA